MKIRPNIDEKWKEWITGFRDNTFLEDPLNINIIKHYYERGEGCRSAALTYYWEVQQKNKGIFPQFT